MTQPLGDIPNTRVTVHPGDFGVDGMGRIDAEQRLVGPPGRRRLAGSFLIPTELLGDTAFDVGDLLDQMLDRRFRPWRHPDPCPMPRLVLFPAVDRAEQAWHRLQDRRIRARP